MDGNERWTSFWVPRWEPWAPLSRLASPLRWGEEPRPPEVSLLRPPEAGSLPPLRWGEEPRPPERERLTTCRRSRCRSWRSRCRSQNVENVDEVQIQECSTQLPVETTTNLPGGNHESNTAVGPREQIVQASKIENVDEIQFQARVIPQAVEQIFKEIVHAPKIEYWEELIERQDEQGATARGDRAQRPGSCDPRLSPPRKRRRG